MQEEITRSGPLLTEKGEPVESGWAKRLLLDYKRDNVNASRLRIKEWDYYEVTNPDYGIVLLIYDVGYFARALVKWMDFRNHDFEEAGETILLSRGCLRLPATADSGDILFSRNGALWECRWDHERELREFNFSFPKFRNGKGIEGSIRLRQPRDMDTMVNVIPFKRKNQFVYVQKVNCMVPEGSVRVAGEQYSFSEENHSYGCLDWSRSVFPYHVEWRWCTASGRVNGRLFGFNIDYGFGTESGKNMVFYGGRGHHLDEAWYSFDEKDPEKEWVFNSNDGRVNLSLRPTCIDRGGINLILLKTRVLKAYGFFTGRVFLDDGSVIEITGKDRLFGAAEAVVNYW